MHGRGAIVACFATHALITMSVGARMPALRDQAGLDAPSLGLALGAYAVALLAGTRLGGRLIGRFGDRGVLRVGSRSCASRWRRWASPTTCPPSRCPWSCWVC